MVHIGYVSEQSLEYKLLLYNFMRNNNITIFKTKITTSPRKYSETLYSHVFFFTVSLLGLPSCLSTVVILCHFFTILKAELKFVPIAVSFVLVSILDCILTLIVYFDKQRKGKNNY